MQIANETAHQALAYIDAVARHGYALSTEELVAYLQSPGRTVTTEGGLDALVGLASAQQLTTMLGRRRTEAIDAWLKRLNWVEISDKNTVSLTRLGHAVLRELEQAAIQTDAPLEIVLDPEDPVAYARVVRRILDIGDAMLVDPYFGLDHLMTIITDTEISRLLTSGGGRDGKRRITSLRVALEQVAPDRDFEIRATDEIHDRYVIPKAGPIDFIGTSIGGVGRRISVMGRLQPPSADDIREGHEKIWAGAEPLAPPAATGDPGPEQEPDQSTD